jgi:tight adherence protein C
MSPLTAVLFFLFAGATLVFLFWSASQLFTTQEDPLGDRLEELQSHALVATSRVARRRSGSSPSERFLYLVSLLPGADDWLRGSERLLKQAGSRRKEALAVYVALTLFFVLMLVTATIWIQSQDPTTSATSLIGGLGAALILGFMIPKVVLKRMVKSYRRKLQVALPDTVDLLGIVLGTGLALDQAMMRVSEEMDYIYPELAAEFATVVMQVRAGQDRSVAFNQFVRRTGIEDIKSLAAMIIQSEKFGTSLAVALKVYAEGLRKRRALEAEAAVAKAGIKMLFPIVIFILPVLFVITLVPGLLSVLKDLKILTAGR